MGTNSFHLLVAQADSKGYLHTLDAHKETVRLGEGINSEGEISEDKIELAVAAIKRMKEIAKQHKPIYRVIATQATRASQNYEKFLEKIEQSTGLRVEIIDGLEEARLTYLGMRYCHQSTEEITLGLDIGGGSTEVVVAKGNKVLFMTSLKLGALTSSKRFFHMSTPSEDQIDSLKGYILTRLAPLLQDGKSYNIQRAFATSGTAKAIGRLHHMETKGEYLEQANGYKFSAKEIAPFEDRLCKLASPLKIKNYYDLDSRRAEIIIAGTLIFSKVSEIFAVPEWTVSTYGIREGIALDTYSRLNIQLDEGPKDQQWKSLESLAVRLNLDLNFANSIKDCSLNIFDQCVSVFPKSQLPEKAHELRPLLAAAAFLNEAGKFINFVSHHKHTYYLISQANLLGFSREEKHIVALINRFSRKKVATESKAERYPYLKGRVATINFLSACIRISRSLYRSRTFGVRTCEVTHTKDQVHLLISHLSDESIDAEVQTLKKEVKAINKSWGTSLETQFQEIP